MHLSSLLQRLGNQERGKILSAAASDSIARFDIQDGKETSPRELETHLNTDALALKS